MIFDECHHATNDASYKKIMENFYEKLGASSRPRILGLTASISGEKINIDRLETAARNLEKTFHARIETGSDPAEIAKHSTSAEVVPKHCENYEEKRLKKDKKLLKIIEVRFRSNE